jgi:hypothetical protein
MEVCVESRVLLISPVAEWCENGSWKYEQNRVNMKTNTGGDPFILILEYPSVEGDDRISSRTTTIGPSSVA